MNFTIRGKNKQNLSNPINKGSASFVPIEIEKTERFKYKIILKLSKYTNNALGAIKHTCNKIKGMIQLKLNMFDFKAASGATIIWLMNAFIEGIIVNFAVWGLLGWRFNLITIMAWGVAVKQLLDIYWRLRINGTTTKLPEKN
jgi:hypothetical protein